MLGVAVRRPHSGRRLILRCPLRGRRNRRDTQEDTMKAEVGDRIVVASGTLHRPIRDGEILQAG